MFRSRLAFVPFAALAFAAHAQTVYSVNVMAIQGDAIAQQSGAGALPLAYAVSEAGNLATGSALATNGGALAASVLTQDSGSASSAADLSYVVTLVGPASSTPIPIEVRASGSTQAAGTTSGNDSSVAGATADIFVSAYLTFLSASAQSIYGSTATQPTFKLDQTFTVLPGASFTVQMIATASSGGLAVPGGSAQANVDPSFTIDPAYASSYQLVGIPAAVPEPGVAALMAAGLALLRGASWRRRGAAGPTARRPQASRA